MRRLLITTVVIMALLWSTTLITAQASSILQTRSFRTNLVKGEYVEAEAEKIEINENPEVQESVDDEPIDVSGEIITDRAEIVEPEPQEPDEHTDVSASIDIEAAVDDGELEDLEGSIETDTKEPDETIEEHIGETEEENEEEHETEIQSTQ